jgi:hypothetical protein
LSFVKQIVLDALSDVFLPLGNRRAGIIDRRICRRCVFGMAGLVCESFDYIFGAIARVDGDRRWCCIAVGVAAAAGGA